jgi:hypothetical protein
MGWKVWWLGVAGVIVLMVGLYLAFMNRPRLYPGLVIVVGCLSLATFFLINHRIWSGPDR